MKHTSIVLFLALSFSFCLSARSQVSDSLTLDEAIRQVLKSHPQVEQASAGLDASLARVEASRSSYYPTSDIQLGYVRLGPVAELGFPGLGDFKLYPENNYDEHISLKQTVYDFGKTTNAVELSQWNVTSANNAVQLTRTNLAYQTTLVFYSILFLRQNIQVQGQQIDALKEHLLVTQKKVQAGTVTDFDVLTTQVRIAAAQNLLYDLENSLRKQEVVLRRLLGFPADAEIRLQGEFTQQVLRLDRDSLVLLAKGQRIELKQAVDAERIASLQEQAASLRDRPALKVNLEYGLKNGYIPNLDVLRGNWVLGVEASVPIFNGYRTRSEEQEAAANSHGAKARTRDTERMVVAEVQQAVSDVQTNTEKIQTSQLQVEQATQALSIAKVRYENGVITNLDLIDSQTALAQAELSHLDALYQYVISSYALQKAIGTTLVGE